MWRVAYIVLQSHEIIIASTGGGLGLGLGLGLC